MKEYTETGKRCVLLEDVCPSFKHFHHVFLLVMLILMFPTQSFQVRFRKGFKDGDHRAYLAKAAFAQYFLEHQVADGEAYSGNCRCGWGWAQALKRFVIAICYRCTFANTE